MLKELEQSLEKFEWQNVRMEDLERMSLGEVKCMLTDSAVWVVKQEWEEEAKIGSKLQMMGKLMEYDIKVRSTVSQAFPLRFPRDSLYIFTDFLSANSLGRFASR